MPNHPPNRTSHQFKTIVIVMISVKVLIFVSYIVAIVYFFLTQEPNYNVLVTWTFGTALIHYFATKYIIKKGENILSSHDRIEDSKET
tara:strand:+ start:48963 stop:49226 length:264 start_codon:yes stop_codon:yes gene_type:complete